MLPIVHILIIKYDIQNISDLSLVATPIHLGIFEFVELSTVKAKSTMKNTLTYIKLSK